MPASTPVPFQSTVASVLLDALRGFAALLVCLGHWRYLLFVDYPQVTAHRSLFFLPYLMCTMGSQAVMLFFVLSGYLVGGHVLRAVNTGKWSWRSYLLQRGVRLWIVLLPALVLGGLLDLTVLHFHPENALYLGGVPNHITYDVRPHLGWAAFFGNAFFIQSILVPVFGSNGPLWSLANEFWYYILFPLGLFALRSYYPVALRIVFGIVCLGLMFFVGWGIFIAFPVWLLGVLLAVTPVRGTPEWARWLALALYCPFFAAVTRSNIIGRFNADYALGIATFVLLWVFLGAQERAEGDGKARWYVRPSRTAAGFSYTLYLVHTPMLMVLTAVLAGEQRWVPDGRHLAAGFGVLTAVIAYGYGVALLTEFRTAAVRDWVLRRVPG